jgi:hypothetical protein
MIFRKAMENDKYFARFCQIFLSLLEAYNGLKFIRKKIR